MRLRRGKGNKGQVVPLGGEAPAWLELYLARVRPQLLRASGVQAVFLNRWGTAGMQRAALTAIVRRLVRRSGLGKGVTPHTLRHTFGSRLLERDVPSWLRRWGGCSRLGWSGFAGQLEDVLANAGSDAKVAGLHAVEHLATARNQALEMRQKDHLGRVEHPYRSHQSLGGDLGVIGQEALSAQLERQGEYGRVTGGSGLLGLLQVNPAFAASLCQLCGTGAAGALPDQLVPDASRQPDFAKERLQNIEDVSFGQANQDVTVRDDNHSAEGGRVTRACRTSSKARCNSAGSDISRTTGIWREPSNSR